jgi:proteic killer suppression protein
MEIFFKSSKLRKTMSSEAQLVREFGKENARLIMRRMVVLDAAGCLAEVPTKRPERCHALSGKRQGQYAVDVKHPYRIVLQPANDPIPLVEDGSVDLERVTSIRILGVEDYH